MSDLHVTAERISHVSPHPNADKLEIAVVLGTQTVVAKGRWAPGGLCAFFPPDICIPPDVAERLGVKQYLRTSWKGTEQIKNCRVAATRLRGEPSFGFVAPLPAPDSSLATPAETESVVVIAHSVVPGTILDSAYGAWKHEPPNRVQSAGFQGQMAADPPNFPKYTEIQHYYRNTSAFPVGMEVVVTEKIHGQNVRLGLINKDDSGIPTFVCGSRKHARQQFDEQGRESVYWKILFSTPGLVDMMNRLSFGGLVSSMELFGPQVISDVIVFGELFGPGIQDMTYGVPAGEIRLRVFDIMVDGYYWDWDVVKRLCGEFRVPIVHTLYNGPFDPSYVNLWTHGATFVSGGSENTSKFKGREGCVIKSPIERWDSRLGRVIAKSISADYLGRQNAEDWGEM